MEPTHPTYHIAARGFEIVVESAAFLALQRGMQRLDAKVAAQKLCPRSI